MNQAHTRAPDASNVDVEMGDIDASLEDMAADMYDQQDEYLNEDIDSDGMYSDDAEPAFDSNTAFLDEGGPTVQVLRGVHHYGRDNVYADEVLSPREYAARYGKESVTDDSDIEEEDMSFLQLQVHKAKSDILKMIFSMLLVLHVSPWIGYCLCTHGQYGW